MSFRIKELAMRMEDLSLERSSGNSLSHGYPGILLLFATLDQLYNEEGWDTLSHQYVLKIKEAIETSPPMNFSLFGGLAGACFAIQQASRGKSRYQKLLSRLNPYLIQNTKKNFLDPLKEKIELGMPVDPSLYDNISGICGIGTYAMSNLECPQMHLFLHDMLNICICLTRKILVGSNVVPGWYVPQQYQFLEKDKKKFPKGNFNLGIAHGISGVLAFLCIAASHGIVLKGHMEAIQTLTTWILSKKQQENKQIYWKGRIGLEEELGKEQIKDFNPITGAWCYGTAGIARTLYLAGKILHNPLIQKNAFEAFLSIFPYKEEHSFLSDPSFCHGVAGLLTITRLMLRDTGLVQLKEEIQQLENFLMNLYNPQFPFGFKDKALVITEKKELVEFSFIDNPGILTGVSGILLSLLPINNTSSWMLPFLIEGGSLFPPH